MTRKGKLWLMAVVFALSAGGMAVWAGRTYSTTDMEQGFYYVLLGYTSRAANEMAAADAARASGGIAIAGWILLASALLAAILAVASKSDQRVMPTTVDPPPSAELPN